MLNQVGLRYARISLLMSIWFFMASVIVVGVVLIGFLG